jgi:hypothetical protein
MIVHSSYTKVEDADKIYINRKTNDAVPISEEYVIERVWKAKYLGLVIDCNLKFEEHAKYVENKAVNVAGVLWKMRRMLSTETKKLIYKTLLEPHLNYLVTVWGSASDSTIKSVQVMQNRAIRNVYSLDRLTNRVNMFLNTDNDYLPIRAMCYVNAASFVFNVIHEKIHTNIRFSLVDAKETRQKGNLRP